MSYESEPRHVDGDPVSEPSERPEDFDEWLNSQSDAFGTETPYMLYIRRLEASAVPKPMDNRQRDIARLEQSIDEPETAAELERLRQERAQMGLRIFVAEKELKKIALNHAEPARSGVVAAIGALNGEFPNGAKGTGLEMDRLRETNRDLSTILADLREWMSVAGMAVEKDVDMLFVLKGRLDALTASNSELVGALEHCKAILPVSFDDPGIVVLSTRAYLPRWFDVADVVVNALARAKVSG